MVTQVKLLNQTVMSNAFERLIEKSIPELNILTAAGADIKPGSVMESLEKDIIIGYLPKYLDDSMIDKSALQIEEFPYDIKLQKLSGLKSADGALDIMKMLGLKFDSTKAYKIDLEINGLTSFRFANDINIIDFEIALGKLAKKDKKLFKRFRNHFLVTRVVYAKEFKVTVEIEKAGKFEADLALENINVAGNTNFQKKENAILVSNNTEVPFGVVCFQIKNGKLKEKDK